MSRIPLARRTAIALVAILLCGSAAIAQRDSGRGRRGPGTEQLEKHLGLTADQAVALKEARNQHSQQIRELQREIFQKRREINTELQGDIPNTAVIAQLLVDIEGLNKQVKSLRDEFRQQTLATLGDEQKEALAALEQAKALQSAIRQAAMFGLLEDSGDPGSSFGRGGFRGWPGGFSGQGFRPQPSP